MKTACAKSLKNIKNMKTQLNLYQIITNTGWEKTVER